MGRGKRAGTYGAILVAAYDKERDRFPILCKVGSGWTDKDLEDLPQKLEPYRVEEKHRQVEFLLEADVWFKPQVVIEVNADEITLKPYPPLRNGRDKKRLWNGPPLPSLHREMATRQVPTGRDNG